MQMKEFWAVIGYSVVKLYINQIAMSVFGLMVIGYAGGQEGILLLFLASVLSIGLYLFIIYSMMWDAGAKAAAKTLRAEDAGVRKIETPFYIILFGSTVNIILYVIYGFARFYSSANNLIDFSTNTVDENAAAVAAGGLLEIIIKMTNSIYMGFEAIFYTENMIMRTPAYYFFLTLIPLFAVGIGAYYLGASEISIMRKLGFKPKHKNISNTHIDYSKNKK